MMAMESVAAGFSLAGEPQNEMRPRSHSEGAAFQNSYDYTVPYEEYDGKNGADLALEMLGARTAPFDVAGQLRVPPWVGAALAYPPVPLHLSSEIKREPSKAVRRSLAKLGITQDCNIDGFEELVVLGLDDQKNVHFTDSNDDERSTERLVPRIISELVEDKVVPQQYAALPPEEIAKMFQINPRQTSNPSKSSEQTISYAINPEGRTIIEFATLPQIVRAYASDAQDNTAIQRLVLAHEHFMDSVVMFTEFTEFFSTHQSSSAADQIIQARILNVLKRWIEMSWSRMKQVGLEPLMTKFMDSLGNAPLKSILEKAIMQSERLEKDTSSPSKATASTSISSKQKSLKGPKKGETWSLTDFDPLEVAKQLTLIDFELAQQVNLDEMLKAQWVEEPGAPSLFAASKRVNDLTYWLAYQIVSTPILKKRVKVITTIIKIAKHLLALNSFNSFMAVYLAFNLAPTARLTNTWKHVPARHFQVWKRLSKIMSPMQNFGSYREAVQTVQPPMILCQEVLLKDLLYEEEGRPDYVAEGVIDMTKMDAIGRLIDGFRQCRTKPYSNILANPTLQEFLRDIPSWDSAEEAATQLDDLSRLVEPSSIHFPTNMSSDAASRVKSLGTLPTWKRDADALTMQERLAQLSNPRPSQPSGEQPLSPRSAVIAAASSSHASASSSAHSPTSPNTSTSPTFSYTTTTSGFTKGITPKITPPLGIARLGSSGNGGSSTSLSSNEPGTPHSSSFAGGTSSDNSISVNNPLIAMSKGGSGPIPSLPAMSTSPKSKRKKGASSTTTSPVISRAKLTPSLSSEAVDTSSTISEDSD